MRILLANKFYYRRGGDCICMLNLEQLLRANGHDVAVFSMDYPENLDTQWKRYFPSEIKFNPGPGLFKTFARTIGYGDVRRRFEMLLDDFKPDVVHVHNIHTQLSPVIVELAHKRGIRTVWTIHDYKLLCPRYDCLRGGTELCEDCFTDKSHVLRYRCMKNSLPASLLAFLEARKWSVRKLTEITDVFLCPSQFIASKMEKGGFPEDKITAMSNFIDVDKCAGDVAAQRGDYYCYVGRLSHEKGVDTLIKAAGSLPYRLVVVGDGPLRSELEAVASPNVEFVGFKSWDEVKAIVGKARFNVIPSEWYENNPLSVIESLSLGTPVIGAKIGGIPELIDPATSGAVFESKNASELAEKISENWNRAFDYLSISNVAKSKYNSQAYLENLLKLYFK